MPPKPVLLTRLPVLRSCFCHEHIADRLAISSKLWNRDRIVGLIGSASTLKSLNMCASRCPESDSQPLELLPLETRPLRLINGMKSTDILRAVALPSAILADSIAHFINVRFCFPSLNMHLQRQIPPSDTLQWQPCYTHFTCANLLVRPLLKQYRNNISCR